MTSEPKCSRISDSLANIKSLLLKNKASSTKLSQILDELGKNSILLVIIFFALPLAIPFPYPPGVSTLLGLPLILLSFQLLLFHKKVYLPSMILNYEVKNSLLCAIIDRAIILVTKIEYYIKPRFLFLQNRLLHSFISILLIIATIFIMLPIPFTNAIPAQAMMILVIAMINYDGLAILAGILWLIIGVVIALLFLTTGTTFLIYLWSLLS